MQISEKDVIDWLLGIVGVIGALFTALYWYIWRGDRERIHNLETRMENIITKPEVEHIVDRVQQSFKNEHRQIIEELRDLRGEIINILKQPWQGDERRRK